jgi:hypothetical protein
MQKEKAASFYNLGQFFSIRWQTIDLFMHSFKQTVGYRGRAVFAPDGT